MSVKTVSISATTQMVNFSYKTLSMLRDHITETNYTFQDYTCFQGIKIKLSHLQGVACCENYTL